MNADQSKTISKKSNISIPSSIYDLISYTLSLPVPHFLLNGFVKPSTCPKDVSFHACSRLNESDSLTEEDKKKL
jgi:hypothetical protein